jgi:hypothetical protein
MSWEKEPTKAHCVGRHIIEMPVSFSPARVTTGVFKATGAGADDPSFNIVVSAAGMTTEKFVAEVEKRQAKLGRPSIGTADVLRLAKRIGDDAFLFRVQEIDDAYVSEITLLRGSTMVTVRLDSYRDQYLAAEESLLKLAAGIKEYKQANQSDPGAFCLGTVILNGDFEEERGHFLFRNGAGVDVSLEIITYGHDEGPPLLARMSDRNSLLTIFDVHHKVLRKGERMVAGMRAQEWLAWAKLSDDPESKARKFALETIRATPSKATPSISVTLDTAQPNDDGSRTKTVIPDEEAMQLWDRIVSSIRPVADWHIPPAPTI